MQILSKVEKKQYLKELRCQMESWFAFGQQRFTGLVLGNFLYISRHAGYEWNRRITNEKSRAIGFVRKRSDGCTVNVVCLRGYMDPVSLVLLYLFGLFVFLLNGVNPFEGTVYHLLAAGISLLTGLISAVQCWLTERGQESMAELITLLKDPVRFWIDTDE